MRKELVYFFQLIKRLGIIILVFFLIRGFFFFFNSDAFPALSFSSFFRVFGNAIRFDLAAIIYINALFILLSLLPLPYRQFHWYKYIQKILFLLFNGLAIAFEVIDIGFFSYAFRRSIGSDLSLFQNTAAMIPHFFMEFWYLLLFFVCLIWVINYLYNRTSLEGKELSFHWLPQTLIFILGIGLAAIGARGGFQLRPIMSITAAKYVKDIRMLPLMTNTSLGLIFSSQQRFLKKKNYFEDSQLSQVFKLEKTPDPKSAFEQKNVMILVLESFGKEYIKAYHDEADYTPFLDSLISKSFSSKESFANGLRSTQGIVAITSSIPSLMNDPLMFSAYQSNRVDGLARLLRDEGYYTAFFHGANPGSMEFEKFSKLCGFEHYFDRADYGKKDYDGQWGIWDEPYFQYAANKLNEIEDPFCALIFSLTSHHPYKVPDWFKKQYPDERPVFRSVRYTDYALKLFFETASKMPWFKNTLFVITADHIGKSFNNQFKTYKGIYEIPILLFDPSSVIENHSGNIAQQIDIMPTVLDYLHYDKPFNAFGNSMLDSTSRSYAYMYTNNIYQNLDEKYLLLFENDEAIGLYDHEQDPLLQYNLKDSLSIKKFELESQLKAVIQTHHKALIENRLYLKKEK